MKHAVWLYDYMVQLFMTIVLASGKRLQFANWNMAIEIPDFSQ